MNRKADLFEIIKCSDYCEKVADGTHDSPKATESGKLLVTSKNIKNSRLTLETAYFISLKDFDEINKRSKVDKWDLLLTMIGTVGEVCVVLDESPDFAIKNVGLLKTSNELKSKWLYYYLRSSEGKQALNERQKGTTQAYLALGEIRNLPIPIYKDSSLTYKAVKILDSLDKKIDLLNEINQTLESIAQAIFKSWFADFDPVHAKQQGVECTGIDKATADLFPNSFVESELGLIPKDWEVKSLDEIATYLNGLALQKFPPKNNEWLPVIKIAQLRKGDADGADKAGAYIKSEYIIKDGDVLFSWSGTLEVEIWCGGLGALNQHLFKVSSKNYSKWFYYYWTKYHLEAFRQIAAGKATTMGHIQRAHLKEAKVLIPPDNLLDAMNHIFSPLVSKIISNAVEAKTLGLTRDTLLPRLISGKLDLSNIEEELEGVA
ncbi:restriction endonuclease subunit S [Polynucleobacter paneuropaeus]|nr:restriction endonuclease subunit S [Polynucleobacter paneuropaeus]